MTLDMDFGDLAKKNNLVGTCEHLKQKLDELRKFLDQLLPLKEHYNNMCLSAQIELDLFFVYTLNSLQWVQLRLQGVDPSKYPIKDELQRIQVAMAKWQEIKDRDKRPTLNIQAAKRFIRSGLYEPYQHSLPKIRRVMYTDEE